MPPNRLIRTVMSPLSFWAFRSGETFFRRRSWKYGIGACFSTSQSFASVRKRFRFQRHASCHAHVQRELPVPVFHHSWIHREIPVCKCKSTTLIWHTNSPTAWGQLMWSCHKTIFRFNWILAWHVVARNSNAAVDKSKFVCFKCQISVRNCTCNNKTSSGWFMQRCGWQTLTWQQMIFWTF